jgi:hypothetical protein
MVSKLQVCLASKRSRRYRRPDLPSLSVEPSFGLASEAALQGLVLVPPMISQ